MCCDRHLEIDAILIVKVSIAINFTKYLLFFEND